MLFEFTRTNISMRIHRDGELEYKKKEADPITDVVDICTKWCTMNGVLKNTNQRPAPVPVTTLPCVTSLKDISDILKVQPYINQLIYDMSCDPEFVDFVIRSVINKDEFSANLYKVYKAALPYRKNQKASFGIYRSDYFATKDSTLEGKIVHKMVEINCISASFPGFIPKIVELHRLLKDRVLGNSQTPLPKGDFFFPDTLKEVGDAIALAYSIYDVKDSYVLFVPQENEPNIYDQISLEIYLLEKHGIPVIYSSLKSIADQNTLELRRDTMDLYVKGRNISVVYYRSAYAVCDYPTENCWDVRTKIEISSAIKCPDIFCHLVGMKKFQEILSNLGCLDKFVASKQHADILKNASVNFYPLNSPENVEAALTLFKKFPKNFVLKPQREGGGNNLFGTKAIDFLCDPNNQHLLEVYTLMDMIHPLESINYLVSNNVAQKASTVYELGVYGIWLYTKGSLHLNNHAGILVRAKSIDTAEGGVCAGGGFLSSLYVT